MNLITVLIGMSYPIDEANEAYLECKKKGGATILFDENEMYSSLEYKNANEHMRLIDTNELIKFADKEIERYKVLSRGSSKTETPTFHTLSMMLLKQLVNTCKTIDITEQNNK